MTSQRVEEWGIEETASHMAEQICLAFQYHDRKDREGAIEAFSTVDGLQFAHLDAETARHASIAYVDALWRKDELEIAHMDGGEIDQEALYGADWSGVEDEFRERASLVGMDPRYAEKSTTAWRNHKTGRDYWTPIQQAQVYEIRAAIGDPEYPRKPRYGQSGFGPEPARYALAVELHDMHTKDYWRETREVMAPYYERILRGHGDG